MDAAEEIVAGCFQSMDYFVISGVRIGVKEVDLLAIKLNTGGHVAERVHVEVQVSANPVGVLRTKAGLGKTGHDPRKSAREYVGKKFLDPKVLKRVKAIFSGHQYSRLFVHGKVNKPEQLDEMRKMGIKCIPIGEMVRQASKSPVASLKRTLSIREVVNLAT